MKGHDIIVRNSVLYVKSFIVFIIFVATIIYLIKTANLNLVNIELFKSLVLFLNDMNSNSNILEFIALYLIKFIFNVDVHNLESFFESLNPCLGG